MRFLILVLLALSCGCAPRVCNVKPDRITPAGWFMLLKMNHDDRTLASFRHQCRKNPGLAEKVVRLFEIEETGGRMVRRSKPWTPIPGHRVRTLILPRDIRLGHGSSTPVGTLMSGWDETSDTWQLWRVVTDGPEGESEFVGYISPNAP